ncbi:MULTISPECIES: fimbrial protein [unclassified Pseudomonas]|uniref:fimbrial protein n=1 Tax=unclassified Pseudomonas TaxID=196821 RepID=UPI0015A4015C|nr:MULTISPECIES: type 1 fimbrial protein [unclassified Pseudomonas]NWC93107.1 type 1 fimbrial protein [Pseudomonas sp. IPO3779]NWD19525.1 type 1 fimbrial protein [Pseudomonas sp. IPO3778]
MNGIKSALLTGLLLVVGGVNTYAADVDITVNGRVVAKPCTVSTPPAAVILEELFAPDFAQAGSTSGWHNVMLNLTNCPVGTSSVTATFTGAADDTGYYANQGDALNLQVELRDANENILNNGNSTMVKVDDSQSINLLLHLRVLSVKGNATQGSIQVNINVAYTYS